MQAISAPAPTELQRMAIEVVDRQLALLSERGITPKIGAEIECYAFAAPGDQARLDSFMGRSRPDWQSESPDDDKTLEFLELRLQKLIPELVTIKEETSNADYFYNRENGEFYDRSASINGAVKLELILDHDSNLDAVEIAEKTALAISLIQKWGPEYGLHFDFAAKPIADPRPYIDVDNIKKSFNLAWQLDLHERERLHEAQKLEDLFLLPLPIVPGAGLQYNLSLWEQGGFNLFYDPDAPQEIGPALWQAADGFLDLAEQSTLPFMPAPRSWERLFTRLSYAPQSLSIGQKKAQGHALRHMRDDTGDISNLSSRLELRLPGSDADPYIVMAAFLAGATQGILDKKPVQPHEAEARNQTLDATHAISRRRFAQSAGWKRAFGPKLHKAFLDSTPGPTPEMRALPGLTVSRHQSHARPDKTYVTPSRPSYLRFAPDETPATARMREAAENCLLAHQEKLQKKGLYPSLNARLSFHMVAPEAHPKAVEFSKGALEDLYYDLNEIAPALIGLSVDPHYLRGQMDYLSNRCLLDENYPIPGIKLCEAEFKGRSQNGIFTPQEISAQIEEVRRTLTRMGPGLGVHFDFEADPITGLGAFVDLNDLKDFLCEEGRFPLPVRHRIRQADSFKDLPIIFENNLPGGGLNYVLSLWDSKDKGTNKFIGNSKYHSVSKMFCNVAFTLVNNMIFGSTLPFTPTRRSYDRLFDTKNGTPSIIGMAMDMNTDRTEDPTTCHVFSTLKPGCKKAVIPENFGLELRLAGADSDPFVNAAALVSCASFGTMSKHAMSFPKLAKKQNEPLWLSYDDSYANFVDRRCSWSFPLSYELYEAVIDCAEPPQSMLEPLKFGHDPHKHVRSPLAKMLFG